MTMSATETDNPLERRKQAFSIQHTNIAHTKNYTIY